MFSYTFDLQQTGLGFYSQPGVFLAISVTCHPVVLMYDFFAIYYVFGGIFFFQDGQGIAIRLSKQVNACNRRLKKIVTEYNSLQWPPQTTIFPSHLEFQELCDVSLPLYSVIDEQVGRYEMLVSYEFLSTVVPHLLTEIDTVL